MPPDPPSFAFAPIASPQAEGQPFAVTISALDGQGQPLPLSGAVQLSSPAATISPKSVSFVNGSWSGLVTVFGSATGVTLDADAAGMTGTSAPFTVTGPGAQSASLRGKVTDLTDTPLVGASVYLTPGLVLGPSDATMETVTDGNGRYAFGPLAAGDYTLWAEYGSDPRRKSYNVYPWLSSYGPQTQRHRDQCLSGGYTGVIGPRHLGERPGRPMTGTPRACLNGTRPLRKR